MSERPQNRNLKKTRGPGRPKGTRDSVPRTVRASIKKIYEEIGEADNGETYRKTILRGLKANARDAFPYIKLGASYLDGTPTQTLQIEDQGKLDLGTLRQIFNEVEAERQAAVLDAGGDPEPKKLLAEKAGTSE